MYNKMTEEAGGLPLPQRFLLYNHFLSLLEQLLTRYGVCAPNVAMQSNPDRRPGHQVSSSTGLKRSAHGFWRCGNKEGFVSPLTSSTEEYIHTLTLCLAPPPMQVGLLVRQELMSLAVAQDRVRYPQCRLPQGRLLISRQGSHWAEQIFSLPLPSRTALKHLRP